MKTPPTRGKKWRKGTLIALVLLALMLAVGWLLSSLNLLPGWNFGWAQHLRLPGARRLGPLTIYYTCDTSGQMEPCRCSSGQTGGMSRRLGYLQSQKASPSLLVDAGDVTGGARDWELFEFSYILKGYTEAGYHAVNIGHRELTLGRDRLRDLKTGKVPFISANVFDEQGKLIFKPYRIVVMPGGMRAAIIGIVDADYKPAQLGQNLRVGPPVEALSRWLPELRGKADVTVLLAFAGEATIQTLAGKFEAIDVIVGGNTFRPTGDPLQFGKTLVVLITDKGKAIGRLQLDPVAPGASRDTGRWTGRNEIVKLAEDLPADQVFGQIYEDYKRKLITMDFRPTPDDDDEPTTNPLPRSAQADHYVGAAQCRTCHEKAWQVWNSSAHADAMRSLQGQNNHFNPRCLPCHTVGYRSTDGYVNPAVTGHLANVQCESCHGRGEHHIKLARGETIAARRAVLRKVDCTVCHNQERSPGFEVDTAWAKIAHGK